MANIGSRVFNLVSDKYLSLANEEYVRTLAIGTNWTKLRLGMLMALNPDGTNNLSGTNLLFGLCSAKTNPFGAASTTNFLGMKFGSDPSSDLLTYVANSGNPYYWSGRSVAKKAGSTVTLAGGNALEFHRIIGAGTRGCVRCTNGNTRIHSQLITSGGPRAVELYGGTNFVRVDEISSSGGNGVELGGGTNVVEANLIASTAGVGLRCFAGASDVTAREIRSSAGYGLHHQFVEDPFTLTVNQARIVSTLAAAGGKAVQVDGSDDLTLKDCVLVSSASASTSIDAGAAQNVRLYGSTMANKAAGGNVTFLTGGARFEVDANVR